MQEELTYPTTLQEAILRFADRDYCLAVVAKLRWPDGVVCPYCKAKDPYFLKTRRIWKCRSCKKQFSAKVGTIFEDSPLGLDKWLAVIWMLANCKNGISSCEVARELGVTQKTAWFMLGRVRKAMELGGLEKLEGEVEIDETFVGGSQRFMHTARKAEAKRGKKRGASSQTPVVGLLSRGGEVRAHVVKDVKRRTLFPIIRDNVAWDAKVYTDELRTYNLLRDRYQHEVINHLKAWARGAVHTNNLENFWSLLKRALRGTYVHCDPEHLHRYVTERAFRYNGRKGTNAERFLTVLSLVTGRRLTYRWLTAATDTTTGG
jgi:transposase-like protein